MTKETGEFKKIDPNQSIYQAWAGENLASEERRKATALDYFSATWNFDEVDKEVDHYARSFQQLIENHESSVTFCAPTLPSTMFGFYALNKLGVRVNFVSDSVLRSDGPRYLDDTGTETLIVLDRFYPTVVDAIGKTSVKNVIIASLLDGIGDEAELVKHIKAGNPNHSRTEIHQSLVGAFRNIKTSYVVTGKEYYNFEEFLNATRQDVSDVEAKYHHPGFTSTILYTGGSTGEPKGVEKTDSEFIAMSDVHLDPSMNIYVGKTERNGIFIPPNHPTALVHSIVVPWFYGTTQVLQPVYNKNTFPDDILDLKLNWGVAAPSEFRFPICGGEPVPEDQYKEINTTLKRLGVQNPLTVAYGMSELGPLNIFTFGQRNGRPIPGVKARIIDDEGNELGDNMRGKLEINAPNYMMKGYFNQPELTKQFWTDDMYGKTGDIAIRNSMGEYDVLGRANDSFIDSNGKTHYLFDIENFIYKDPSVLEAEVVKLVVNNGATEVPVAHIVLKNSAMGKEMEVLKNLVEECKDSLPTEENPRGYRFLKTFGTNPISTKRDSQSLRLVRDGYYNLNKDGLYEMNFLEDDLPIKRYIDVSRLKTIKMLSGGQKRSRMTKRNEICIHNSIYNNWKAVNRENWNELAMEYYSGTLTFSEADREVDNFAHSLNELQNDKDSTTAFCTLAQPANLIGFYAINKMGKTASFISPPLLRLNAGECLDDTNAETLITSYDIYKNMQSAIAKTSIKNIILAPLTDYATDRKQLITDLRDFNPRLRRAPAFLIEKTLEKGYKNIKKANLIPGVNYLNYDEFMSATKGDKSEVKSVFMPASTAVYLHTSGTTKKPKIIERGNEDITACSNAYTKVKNFQASPGDKNGQFYPLFPATIFIGNFVAPWYLGMTQVIDPMTAINGKMAESIYRNRINGTTAAPSAYESFLKTNFPKDSMNFLKLPFAGGEPIAKETADDINDKLEYLGAPNPLVVCYGLSEANPGTHFMIGNRELGNRAGKPIPDTESRIVNDDGRIVGSNVRGKIEIKPAAHMLRYFNDPETTKKIWVDDKWMRTGDIAIEDEDGYIDILGRDSESFVDLYGKKHYLFDTRTVLNENKDGAVLKAEASVYNNNIPTAFIELKPKVKADRLKILKNTIERCQRRLPPSAMPVGYRFVESFGNNPYSHKVDSDVLKTIDSGFYSVDSDGLYEVRIFPSGKIQKNHIRSTTSNIRIYEKVEIKA
jgi:long-chain acyl-CoA synthetase